MLPSGHAIEHVKIAETLDAAVRASHWEQPKSCLYVDRGMAVSHHHIGAGDANAEVRVESGGSVTLLTTVPDTGTGFHAILRQIVAETLRLPVEQVRVQVGTTDMFAPDFGNRCEPCDACGWTGYVPGSAGVIAAAL